MSSAAGYSNGSSPVLEPLPPLKLTFALRIATAGSATREPHAPSGAPMPKTKLRRRLPDLSAGSRSGRSSRRLSALGGLATCPLGTSSLGLAGYLALACALDIGRRLTGSLHLLGRSTAADVYL